MHHTMNKMTNSTNIKLFIDGPLGLNTVTIENDKDYKSLKDMDVLKMQAKLIAQDMQATVETELEFFIRSRQKIAEDLNEMSQSNAMKIMGTLRRKITLLSQEYDKMGIWHP